ncbi:MAG: DUF2855 family protein [Gammaproteobacteria bacterium]|nr:DUF2855 family protein [Gammaproteobacteria bacterium]MBT8110346.1 DUF2855 family protein [Gammaproteobacteria bacterium]NND46189.1 DUF2855 family protein [Woeseiaceae bacterium]NNL45049.1 DUF2855 family protein [Woeseiaceae bacterium]
MAEFQIRRDDFTQHRVVDAASTETSSELVDGAIRVKIERFAFTANNITYAVTGDRLGYWQFFPPGGDDTDGWGMMPVWGFAEVAESKAGDVPVGDRLFGYFPPANYLDMTPTRVAAQRIIDGAAHRARLPPAYNSYSRVNAEPGYDRDMDDMRMLLWPLHITSFCLWDALQDKGWYGAKQVVIVSASSKTSIGLAYALDDDAAAPPAIAVTSRRNLDFVKKLTLYEQSVTYETLDKIDAAIPTVVVDMSGNREVLGRLHARLGDNMKRCINVGLTHWDGNKTGDGLNAERSEIFFAPSHIQQRLQDWGPDGFARKTSSFMFQTAAKSRSWLQLRKIDGLNGLAEVYDDICAGRIAADQGLIIEL